MTACAMRVAMVSWHLFVTGIAGRGLGGPHLQRFFVNANVYLAPTSRDIAAQCPAGRWMRRLEPPCLHAFHSPSPSALMPVLPVSRFG